MTKIFTKVSVYIIFIIMVLASFASIALLKVDYNHSKQDGYFHDDNSTAQIESMKTDLEDMKFKLSELQKQIEKASDEEKFSLQREAINLKYRVEMFETAISKNISLYNDNWVSQVYNEIAYLKSDIDMQKLGREDFLSAEDKKAIEDMQTKADKLAKLTDTGDYATYLAYKDELLNQDANYSDDEKKIYIESNAILKKLNPTGESNDETRNLDELVRNLEESRITLLKNIDNSNGFPKPLTPEKRTELENTIAVTLYKLNNNIKISNEYHILDDVLPVSIGIGKFFIIIMIIMVAGSTISNEISTGSIKSLIISPVKRYKIYTAKILALITTAVVALLSLYAIVIITNQIFFGALTVKSFVTASNGVAHEINFYLYQLLFVLVEGISVLAFAMFALMMSTLTRNTAVSVGISIAGFFAQDMIMFIIGNISKREWMNFIPYQHINLTKKILPNYDLFNMGPVDMLQSSTTLTFSLIYLAVAFACILYTGYDSFIRRDIK